MAYNNQFPMNYPYYQNFQQMPQQAPQQNTGFVPVTSENDARMYPVAPGNSVTFINENAPYCYVKTMGFSQLDRPKFEKYKLVKEEDIPAEDVQQPVPITREMFQEDFDSIWKEVNELKEKVTKLSKRRIKEVEVDE